MFCFSLSLLIHPLPNNPRPRPEEGLFTQLDPRRAVLGMAHWVSETKSRMFYVYFNVTYKEMCSRNSANVLPARDLTGVLYTREVKHLN